MRVLTQDQAETLRRMRPQMARSFGDVDDLCRTTVGACAHDTTDHGCPVCVLDAYLASAVLALGHAADALDAYLDRGPAPKPAKQKKGDKRAPL